MEDKEEQIILDYLNLTKEELNKKRNYVDDFESIEKSLDRFYFSVEDEELKETIIEMKRILFDQEEKRFKECLDVIDEFDTFDINDIVDNDSIKKEYEDDAMGGLK